MSYQYIQPTDEQKAKMQNFRDKFEALHDEILQKCNDQNSMREGLKECLIKLQEASFWLNKAITKND